MEGAVPHFQTRHDRGACAGRQAHCCFGSVLMASATKTLMISINDTHTSTNQLFKTRLEKKHHPTKPLRRKKTFLQSSFRVIKGCLGRCRCANHNTACRSANRTLVKMRRYK